MDQVEQLQEAGPAFKGRAVQPARTDGRKWNVWREGAALAGFGIAAGALALTARMGGSRAGRAPPGFAPADRTLAWASPAVFGKTPQRRFYSGTDPDQAVTIEDLRAMAHRRLPGSTASQF
jgi:hypothetical protein